MYNVIEYSNIYSEKSGILCQYYSYEQAIVINNNIIDFPANNNNNNNNNSNSILLKFKKQEVKQKRWHKRCWNNGNIKNLSNFWKIPRNPIN